MENLFRKLLEPVQINCRQNQVLFRAKSPIHSLFYVTEGDVKLERYTEEGKEVITAFYSRNEYVAPASLFNDRYHCQAITTARTTLLQYHKSKVLEVMETHPELHAAYTACLSAEIRDLREQLEFINILDAEERILSFLKSRSRNREYQVPGSLKNLVSQIGLTQETLYRKLKVLENRGIIKRQGKKIVLNQTL